MSVLYVSVLWFVECLLVVYVCVCLICVICVRVYMRGFMYVCVVSGVFVCICVAYCV